MIDLPDVNVWLALADAQHSQHTAAQEYWDRAAAAQVAFCRITMLGFLRISTNRALKTPLTAGEAWAFYQQICALPHVQWVAELPGTEEQFCKFSLAGNFTHRMWTDAYLAAVAVVGNYRLVSLDRDFSRFANLNFLHLNIIA